jgi:hypothetical protein
MTFFLNVWKKRRRRTWLCVSSFFVLLWQLSFLEKNNIVKLAPLLLDLSQKTIDNATAISINISISTNATSQEWVAQSEDTLCSVISGSKLFHTNDNGGNVTYPKPQPFLPVSVLIPQSDKHQTAICHYHCPMHPPHFMQELVRCFSFWRSRPDQTPVLLVPKRQFYRYLTKPPAFLSRFPFSHGILEGLKQGIGLQVTKSYKGGTGLRTQTVSEMDHVSPFAMRSRQDAIALREIFVSTLQTNDTSLKDAAATASLRIGIVNRAGQKRSILNANSMLKTLQDTFPRHQVVLRYFENSTFQEQVDFYSQLDVAVSPHGAQLTGIMFMTPCSAVLELFPDKYYTPFYMSSLAHLFGLVHANWYVSDGDVPESLLPLATRLKNTVNNVCPSLDRVVLGVEEMIKRRHQCRRRLL